MRKTLSHFPKTHTRSTTIGGAVCGSTSAAHKKAGTLGAGFVVREDGLN